MFDFILSQFKVGDTITLHCKNGSYTGVIAFMNKESIVLKQIDGRLCGVKGEDINFFEEVNLFADSKESDQQAAVIVEEVSSADDKDQPTIEDNHEEEDKESKSASDNKGTDSVVTTTTGSKYKVGDVIPLAELQRIDPNFSKRRIPSAGIAFNSVNDETEIQPKYETTSKPLNTDALKKSKSGKSVTFKGGFDALAVLVQDKHQSE